MRRPNMNGQVEKTHDFTLKMRKNMNITGVKDVINFDDSSVNLKTSIGYDDRGQEYSDFHTRYG